MFPALISNNDDLREHDILDDLHDQSTSPKKAIKFIRRMRGDSQAVLLECDDRDYYIVKMVGCPPGPNVLANEWLGTVLATSVGLPVAKTGFVDISPSFIAANPDLMFETPMGRLPPTPGLQIGSLFGGELTGPQRVIEYLPRAQTAHVANRGCFLGMYLFDIWAGQQAPRKAIFRRSASTSALEAVFINHDCLFGGPAWKCYETKSLIRHQHLSLYTGLLDSWAVNAWIGTFRRTIPTVLSSAAAVLPEHWYVGDFDAVRAYLLTRLEDLPDLFERDANLNDLHFGGNPVDRAWHLKGGRIC